MELVISLCASDKNRFTVICILLSNPYHPTTVIKGTRLSVQYILGLLANGADFDEILNEYTHLNKEDILACLMFASKMLNDQLFFNISQDAKSILNVQHN